MCLASIIPPVSDESLVESRSGEVSEWSFIHEPEAELSLLNNFQSEAPSGSRCSLSGQAGVVLAALGTPSSRWGGKDVF